MADVLTGIPLPIFKMRTIAFRLMILYFSPKDRLRRETSSLKDKDMGSMVSLNNKGGESLKLRKLGKWACC